MKTRLLLAALFLVTASPSFATDPATNAMVTVSYSVEGGAFRKLLGLSTGGGEAERLGSDGGPSKKEEAKKFFADRGAPIKQEDVKKFFSDLGVPFPPGSAIVFNEWTSTILVYNTSENLQVFKRVLSSCHVVQTQVEIEAKLIRLRDRQPARLLTLATLTNLPPAKVEVLDRLTMVTISGSCAQVSRWRTLDAYTTTNRSTAAATAQRTNETAQAASMPADGFGSILNATPAVGADGYTMNLTVIWAYRRLNGWRHVPRGTGEVVVPDITERNIATSIVIWDGESVVLNVTEGATVPPLAGQKENERCPEFLIVTARLLDPQGLPIRSQPGF